VTLGEGWWPVTQFFAPTLCPYNATQFPDNIVPANTYISSLCGYLWSSSAADFWRNNPYTRWTATESWYTGTENTYPFDTITMLGGNVITGTNQYEYPFSWLPTASPCCLKCTMIGGTVTVNVWPTSAPFATLVDTVRNYTL
jgi:hypothetical protein